MVKMFVQNSLKRLLTVKIKVKNTLNEHYEKSED